MLYSIFKNFFFWLCCRACRFVAFFLFLNIYLWLHWVFVTVNRLSLVAARGQRGRGRGLLSSCSVQASHYGGLSCCGARALGCFSSCSPWALEQKLSSWGTWAQLFHSMWDHPGPGTELVSPALAGRFFTTEPPEKPSSYFYLEFQPCCRRHMRIIKLQKTAHKTV